MAKRASRYDTSPPFRPDPLGRARFRGLMPRVIAPAPGVLEHRVAGGDRADLLGTRFFNDDRLWWRIADANADFLFATDLTLDRSPEDGPDALGREGMAGAPVLIPAKE